MTMKVRLSCTPSGPLLSCALAPFAPPLWSALARPEGVTAGRRRKCGENITIIVYAFDLRTCAGISCPPHVCCARNTATCRAYRKNKTKGEKYSCSWARHQGTWRSGGIAPLINLGTRWWMVNFTPRPLLLADTRTSVGSHWTACWMDHGNQQGFFCGVGGRILPHLNSNLDHPDT